VLPARDFLDERLRKLLSQRGCALCLFRSQTVDRFLDSVLWERVNDVGFRGSLDRARGFCDEHSRQILDADRRMNGGSLGSAILYAAVLRRRLAELDALPRLRGRRLKASMSVAQRPAACPVCEQVAEGMTSAADRLADRARDPEWRRVLEVTELCLDDLLHLWQAATKSSATADAWEPVGRAQVSRIAALADRLEAFAHHHSQDRRHLMTDDERTASGDALRFLGGRRAVGKDPEGGHGEP
jgi:hypothetical protein